MKKIQEFPRYIRDLYGVQSLFIRLGFDAADTYMGFGTAIGLGDRVLYMQLKVQGNVFNYTVAQVPSKTEQEMQQLWRDFAVAVQGATDDELEECWRDSPAARNMVPAIAALQQKGFEIPKVAKDLAEAVGEALKKMQKEGSSVH